MMEIFKLSLTPSIPLSLFFLLGLLECLKADTRHMFFHQHTLAHSAQLLATAACKRFSCLSPHSLTLHRSPLNFSVQCFLKSHQGCNTETVSQFSPSASLKLLLNLNQQALHKHHGPSLGGYIPRPWRSSGPMRGSHAGCCQRWGTGCTEEGLRGGGGVGCKDLEEWCWDPCCNWHLSWAW